MAARMRSARDRADALEAKAKELQAKAEAAEQQAAQFRAEAAEPRRQAATVEAELAALQAQCVCSDASGAALHAFARDLVENGSDALFEHMVLQARAERARRLAAGSAVRQDEARQEASSEADEYDEYADEDMDGNPTPRAAPQGTSTPEGAQGVGGDAPAPQHNIFVPQRRCPTHARPATVRLLRPLRPRRPLLKAPRRPGRVTYGSSCGEGRYGRS